MLDFKIEKKERVDLKEPENNVVAFQLVDFHIGFYGSGMITTHDTKILSDGRQIVIDGCGFIPSGLDISEVV